MKALLAKATGTKALTATSNAGSTASHGARARVSSKISPRWDEIPKLEIAFSHADAKSQFARRCVGALREAARLTREELTECSAKDIRVYMRRWCRPQDARACCQW